MPACAPQRFLAGDRNLVREAILSASSVLPVEQTVIENPTARIGTAQVKLTGAYTGEEDAHYDIQIVDTAATNPLISAPIFAGEGSGKLTAISSTLDPQQITVQLNDDGLPTTAAAVDFEGVKVVARTAGNAGNSIRLNIDQTPLTFSDTSFSLLENLTAGQGGADNGLAGPAYDWDSAVLGADNIIPSTAHRVAFGDDTSRIYLQYKQFANGAWSYHFVPALLSDVSAGTKVKFVTGGRVVTVGNGVTTESYSDVVTDYDLLNALRTSSALVTVDGVVANDRSPTGQAARELLVRTDAHTDKSTGSGSAAATGFESTFAGAGANTELITATCFAVNAKDSPQAHLGAELWKLAGSVSGDLGQIVTGQPYVHPDGLFGLTIPTRLPDGFGEAKGKFNVVLNYMPRPEGVEDPPLCVGDLKLGPSAVDQTITLKWTKRPSGACACKDMPFDPISEACLGLEVEGDNEVSYSPEALTRLKNFYDWTRSFAAATTTYMSGQAFLGIPLTTLTGGAPDDGAGATSTAGASYTPPIQGGVAISQNYSSYTDASITYPYEQSPQPMGFSDERFSADLKTIRGDFESTLAAIDALTDTGLRADGFSAWDEAVDDIQGDLSPTAISTLGNRFYRLAVEKYRVSLDRARVYAGVSPLGKADASSVTSGDGCWQDYGDAFYWEVVGSDGGVYAPAFLGHVYYSSRRATQDDPYFSTHEFSLQVNCACPAQLLEGDQITIGINGSGFGATYQVGDKLVLPIIAAQALYLAGGQDGNAIQTWNVWGSVDGPLAPFVYDPGSPTSYADGSPVSLAFTYTPGGIPSAKGDRFTFSIEGGRFQWRKDGGSWNGPTLIPSGPVSFDSGLSIEFVTGASPSFVADDAFSFDVLQPWAVSNVQTPNESSWKWGAQSPDSVTLELDLGSNQAVEMLGMAQHTLPSGTTITIEGGTSPGVYTESEAVTWNEDTIAHVMADAWSVRYVRLTIGGSGEASIGWLWLGAPLKTSLSADVQRARKWKISRADGGLFGGGRYLGKAWGFDIEWSEGALNETDAEGLADMLDWIKGHDDEPFIFVPQVERLADAAFQRVDDDSVELTDISAYNRGAAFDRRFSCRFGTSAPWQ